MIQGIKNLAHYRKIKADERTDFDGSEALFDAAWRKMLMYSNGTEITEYNVGSWLEDIASELVNDPKSRFYIYG